MVYHTFNHVYNCQCSMLKHIHTTHTFDSPIICYNYTYCIHCYNTVKSSITNHSLTITARILHLYSTYTNIHKSYSLINLITLLCGRRIYEDRPSDVYYNLINTSLGSQITYWNFHVY